MATEAQERFLRAWNKSHPAELAETMKENGVVGSFDEIDSSDANTVIAQMVAQYGEPGKGEDMKNHHQDRDGNGDGEEGNDNQNGKGKMRNNPYRNGTKESKIANALMENALDAEDTFEDIKDEIGTGVLIFKGNEDGKRKPLPMGSTYDKTSDRTQYGRAKKAINDVRNELIKQGYDNLKNDGHDEDRSEDEGQDTGDSQGQGNGKSQEIDTRHELEILLDNLHTAKDICDRMNADGEPFDTVGLRPFVHAPRMLLAGMPRLAVLDMMTMSWPPEVRRELNDGNDLPPFDQRTLPAMRPVDPMPMDEVEAKLDPLAKETGGRSPYLPALVRLADLRVPILQIGEKGTGKTTNAEHLAMALAEKYERDMPFGFASMTSGTSPGEFKGRITLDGFLPSQFEGIYENGGVYLFDELDAGDENLLTLLNSALANGYFVNQKGHTIVQSDDFVPIAAANTMGLGATSRYTGRNRLDAATLDRWAMGRIRVDFDKTLAEYVFWKGAKETTPASELDVTISI